MEHFGYPCELPKPDPQERYTCVICEDDFTQSDIVYCEYAKCANRVCEECAIWIDGYQFCCKDCAEKQYKIWLDQANNADEIDEIKATLNQISTMPECKGD